MLMATFSLSAQAETVAKILSGSSDVRSALSKLDSNECKDEAYTLYKKHIYISSGLSEKETYKKIIHELRPQQSTASYVGHYIGIAFGMNELIKIAEPTQYMKSAYKVSACAILKAQELGVSDPRMINFTLYVVESHITGAQKMKKSIPIIAKKGFFDMNIFVELVNEISTMECMISFDKAHETHWKFANEKYLLGKSYPVDEMAEVNRVCLNGVSDAMPHEFRKKLKEQQEIEKTVKTNINLI